MDTIDTLDTMDLQLTTASFPYYPLGPTLALARQVGADGVELALTPGLLRHGVERVQRLMAYHQMPVRSVDLGRLRDGDDLAGLGRFVAGLSECRVAVLPAPRGERHGEGLAAYIARLRHGLAALADSDVALTIENAAPAGPDGEAGPLDRFPQLRRLVEEWDLGFTFDTSHAAARGWVITEPLPLMGGRLHNVHLGDFRPAPSPGRADLLPETGAANRGHLIPGQGILPLRAFLRALCRREYRGLLTLDLHPSHLRAWWPPAARKRLAAALTFCRDATRDCRPRGAFTLEARSEAPAEAENDG